MTNTYRSSLIRFVSGIWKMNLVKKVIVGYIFIVFIPNIAFGILFYIQYNNRMVKDYIAQKQNFIAQSINYLQYDLTRVSGSYKLYQVNSSFIEYLSAFPSTEGEYVFSFLKDIRPLFNYMYTSTPFIYNITVYKNNPKVFKIGDEIKNLDSETNFPVDIDSISLVRGIWKYTSTGISDLPQFTYYQVIFDSHYNKKLGILTVTTNNSMLNDFINTLQIASLSSADFLLLTDDHKILYQPANNQFSITEEEVQRLVPDRSFNKVTSLNGKRVIISGAEIDNLGTYLLIIEDRDIVFKDENIRISFFVFALFFMLLLLTVLYFFISYKVTLRITGLAHHMKNVGKDNLSEYNSHKHSFDEIEILIDSYNLMILRINDLVVRVHQEEIMRREAAYLALQAQIKPHFLYGTLETIRMLAEINNDSEVAKIAYSLGKLMRYTLTQNKSVRLMDEIENVVDYMQIFKARMEDKMEFSVVYDDLVAAQFFCPQFLLQPLVENSIQHGISKKTGLGVVQIHIADEGEFIVVEVKDNGIGIPPDKLVSINDMLENKLDIRNFQSDTSGFALFNIKERIKAFYGQDSSILLQSCYGKGTTCTLKLMKRKTNS